jgi:hypothetical protein
MLETQTLADAQRVPIPRKAPAGYYSRVAEWYDTLFHALVDAGRAGQAVRLTVEIILAAPIEHFTGPSDEEPRINGTLVQQIKNRLEVRARRCGMRCTGDPVVTQHSWGPNRAWVDMWILPRTVKEGDAQK